MADEKDLFSIIRDGNLDAVRWRIRRGDDILEMEPDGFTPFLEAASQGHVEICKLLLKHGADINDEDQNGKSALHWAAGYGYVDVCRLLVDRGMEADRVDGAGAFTPLHNAAIAGYVEACRFLVSCGADPSFVPEDAWEASLTPFQSAVESGQLDAVRFFVLECGQGIGQRTMDGRDLYQVATEGSGVKALLRSLETELAVKGAIDAGSPDEAAPTNRTSTSMSPL